MRNCECGRSGAYQVSVQHNGELLDDGWFCPVCFWSRAIQKHIEHLDLSLGEQPTE